MVVDRKIDIIELNKRAWDSVAYEYNWIHYGNVSALFDFFCDNLPAEGRVLDVGSGTGVPFAKMLVDKGFNVVGIDVSSRMVDIARENVPQAEFREMSMTDIAFRDEFDGALSQFSMLLLDPPRFEDVTGRIVNSLRNGGLFLLALNEPRGEDADVDEEAVVEIMGEKMYSRAYTEREVLDTFIPLDMKLLKIQREVCTSEEFGEEHVMEFVFQKIQ
jgi:SAM-dependent methyltransferase